MAHVGLTLAMMLSDVTAATTTAVVGGAEDQKYRDGAEFNSNLASDRSVNDMSPFRFLRRANTLAQITRTLWQAIRPAIYEFLRQLGR
ncbi:hypothetical protein BZA05DRAFT_400060 [Tricharina praecox]|uniref:uncharacterized protein n=1 Tax=Tricharina praecox TaxID=43433 RepID=UPI00221E8B5C|nr:uncharacterized protein BZA05DRAFT_400060 [Tricharina praecox]KAI5850718.1 hypothetical protein BZA05DRAFT_400060 [Tricharina praecox]